MSTESKALLISLIAAVPIGLVTWALVDTYLRFVRSGGASNVSTGEKLPFLIRFSMPYIKGFSRIFGGILRSKGVVNEAERASPWQPFAEKKPVNNQSMVLRWLYNKTKERLQAAGTPHGFEVEDYWGFVVFCVLVCAVIGLVFLLTTGWPLILVGFLAVGVILPFAHISDIIRRRQTRIRKELPFALDLLTLSVEAGMDFTAALANIVERLKNSPLAQEFDQTVKEVNIGKQRADSLRDMAARLGMAEVNAVASALIQADQLGTGLGEVLRIQADDVRTKRFQNAEKRASETPVKMLFPLVAFIFPVTFLIIAAPLIITLLKYVLR